MRSNSEESPDCSVSSLIPAAGLSLSSIWRTTDLTGWIRFGFPAGLSALTLWGLFFIDRYLLAALRDQYAVGIYSVGAVIGEKAVSIPTLAFFTAASPLLVRAFEHHGRSEVERLMRAYTRVLTLFGLPIVAYLVANAGILVPVLAGTQYYQPAAAVAPVIALGSFLYGLALIGNTGLVVARRTAPLVVGSLAGLTVNIVANLIFTPIQFGLRNLPLAAADILVVLGTIVWSMVAVWAHARWVAAAQVPYLVWVGIATVLQLAITVANW